MRFSVSLNHYQVIAPLGSGEMGEVWRARDTKLGREGVDQFLTADYPGQRSRNQSRYRVTTLHA